MKKYIVSVKEIHILKWDVIEAEDEDTAVDIANNNWSGTECTSVEVIDMFVEEVK